MFLPLGFGGRFPSLPWFTITLCLLLYVVHEYHGKNLMEAMNKNRAVNQGRQAVIQLIRSSQTFEEGAEGNRVRFGQTGIFDKRFLSTEVVHVGIHNGSYDKLLLTAKDGDLRIQSIQILFGNGRLQTVYGGFLVLAGK